MGYLSLRIHETDNPARCLACPPDCRECSKDESDCECYTHQDNHPDDRDTP